MATPPRDHFALEEMDPFRAAAAMSQLLVLPAPRQRGTIKWYNAQKGWGFIAPDGGTNVLLLHISTGAQGVDTVEAAQRVEFTVAQGTKGPIAEDVIFLPGNGDQEPGSGRGNRPA